MNDEHAIVGGNRLRSCSKKQSINSPTNNFPHHPLSILKNANLRISHRVVSTVDVCDNSSPRDSVYNKEHQANPRSVLSSENLCLLKKPRLLEGDVQISEASHSCSQKGNLSIQSHIYNVDKSNVTNAIITPNMQFSRDGRQNIAMNDQRSHRETSLRRSTRKCQFQPKSRKTQNSNKQSSSMTNCPVCQTSISFCKINEHLDTCLASTADKIKENGRSLATDHVPGSQSISCDDIIECSSSLSQSRSALVLERPDEISTSARLLLTQSSDGLHTREMKSSQCSIETKHSHSITEAASNQHISHQTQGDANSQQQQNALAEGTEELLPPEIMNHYKQSVFWFARSLELAIITTVVVVAVVIFYSHPCTTHIHVTAL